MRDKPLIAIDMPILVVLVMLCALSMVVQYSASSENMDALKEQGVRIGIGFVLLLICAQIPPSTFARWSPYLYFFGLLLLFAVIMIGVSAQGARRWLNFGLFYVQPAEVMKLAVPMTVSWLFSRLPLPPSPFALLLALVIVLVPAMLVVVQPDLGTAILICIAGMVVIFFAGVSWKLIATLLILLGSAAPVLWNVMLQDYQRRRIMTLFDPWSDPLGAGYHTIQSIIAVGSGGIRGKGWLTGTQSRLDFIPERSTDFIFAVYAEEFGFVGVLLLLFLYLFLGYRGLMISFHTSDTYSRLLASSLAITFFCYVFVNIGMVVGILPVVGVTLPLLSYGGSSMVTLMIGFGILMSIRRHRNTFMLR